jgi:hypothetical protein
VNFILIGENKILIKTLSIFLIIIMTLPVGAFAYKGTTSSAEASASVERGILPLQQVVCFPWDSMESQSLIISTSAGGILLDGYWRNSWWKPFSYNIPKHKVQIL